LVTKITVRAPSSTANLGPGFDTFGLAIDAFYDEVTLTKIKSGITIITDDDIPTNPENNTAGLVIKNMKNELKIKEYRLDLEWVVVRDLLLQVQLRLINYLN
jgi:homoserine kinase